MANLTTTELRALGTVPSGAKVLELAIKDRKWHKSFNVQHWRVNSAGKNGAIVWNITTPPTTQIIHAEPFDIVTNFGFTERFSPLAKQEACWRNIHNVIKPNGGRLVCTTRRPGHPHRIGVFFPHPKFYKLFARLNNYVIEDLWTDEERNLVCCRLCRGMDTGGFVMPKQGLLTKQQTKQEAKPNAFEKPKPPQTKPKKAQQPTPRQTSNQWNTANLQKIQDFKVDPSSYDMTCYIIGGGPSLKGFDWNLLGPDKFVIAINRAYEVLPEAQIVYLTDKDFWERHKEAMIRHKGQMIRGAINPEREPKHPDLIYYKLTGPHGYETTPGCLKHGSNSAYAVLNLVSAHYGFKKVYLLGIDMKWGNKGKKTSHWHDGHRRIDPESTYKKMKTSYDTIKPQLIKAGVEVYNVNRSSALNTFPKVSFDEVFKNGKRTAGG